MILAECKQALMDTYEANPQVVRSTNFWRRSSWWDELWVCENNFVRANQSVSDFLNDIQQGTAVSWIHNAASTQSIEESDSWIAGWNIPGMDQAMRYVKMLWYVALLAVLGYLFWKLIRYMLVFLYDVTNARRIVYMKVLQTRGESKSEREIQKELAKDMKEKIGRMWQVYNNLHKLGQLSASDNILRFFFKKPKVSLIYQYEDGMLNFIIGVYPEYQSIVEWAISAQYSSSSLEIVEKPEFFGKKYNDIIPLQPTKEPAYTIKIFKHMPDDPLNNIIDSIGKVSKYDTLSIVMPIKPVGRSFNKRAQFVADALYRKKESLLKKTAWWKFLLMPWKVIEFLVKGPSESMIKGDTEGPDGIVRMVKSQEESYNAMAEEASNWWFMTWLLLISSSDNPDNPNDNINNLLSTYSIFTDQYANGLDQPEWLADLLGFIVKPLWRFAATFQLPNFFFVHNVFSVNELSSLFHLPDGVFNRSPIISWLDYKVLPGPDTLPVFTDDDWNGFVMSGMVAEKYRGGDLSKTLENSPHRAVGSKTIKKPKLVPIEQVSKKELKNKDTVEKDGKKYVEMFDEKTVRWYKMYRAGVLLGINIYRNRYSPVYFMRDDRTRHQYCVGKSGTGKSVYMQTLARQDIWNGDGACIIDPHGDLAEDMLEYIPKSRAKDVIFFDAGNEDRPMGLNLYEIDTPDQADRTVNDATEIFLKMFWPEIFGPRIQEYFKYGSLTILEDFEDRPTLLDVPRLYTDETYREFKIKRVKNPVVKNFWEKTYNAMGDREKQEIIPYFTSKFVSFNTNRLIRNIIWQTKSWFNFKDAMDNQKIVLVSLSKGKIGELNAQLLGMIMVSQIYNAAMGRASMNKDERKDFYLYVDEFQNFVSWTFADILSEARKYRLCLIMAHQYIAQLEPAKGLWSDGWGKGDVKAAVFGNCGTIQSFKIGANDAEFLEKEYAPVLSAQDIVGIANYKAYIKLNINNTTTRVFSMTSIYTQDYRNKKIADVLKRYSAKKYGRRREFVDAEIAARLWLDGWDDTPELADVPPEEMKPQIPNPVSDTSGSSSSSDTWSKQKKESVAPEATTSSVPVTH